MEQASTKTIFVQIASYRDDELPKTIQSCLESARYPERLRFGIFHQWDNVTKDCIDRYRSDERFRIEDIPWQDSLGVGYARYRCNRLYDGEDFMMQIDSHMRFDVNWDSAVLTEWDKCRDEKAILSAYPSPFLYKDNGVEERLPYGPTQLIVKKFAHDNVPIFKGMAVDEHSDGSLRRAMYIAGGFVFGRGVICREVPYTQEVCFTGEEMVYSLRLFSHGYSVYTPNWLGIYHLYERPESSRFWDDMPRSEEEAVKRKHAMMMKKNDMFLRTLLGGGVSDVLGQVRTLQEFENYSGISFTHKLIHPDQTALKEPPYAYSGEWIERMFKPFTIDITLDLAAVADKYANQEIPLMWRVKLLTEHDIEVHSEDILYEILEHSGFQVRINAQVRQKPTHCRVRPYCGGDEWYEPEVIELEAVTVSPSVV